MDPEHIPARYRVLNELGRGGMGTVYKAVDQENRKIVALKLLTGLSPARRDRRIRFRREFRAALRLAHPNIVSVYDTGDDDSLYYTMEYVRGPNIAQYFGVDTQEVPEDYDLNSESRMEKLFSVLHQICLALGYIHDNKIVHRDLKPENILITTWNSEPSENVPAMPGLETAPVPIQDLKEYPLVKVMDFGLAIHQDAASGITHPGVILGTFAYMSPEQASGREVDGRSDLYSLGVILYRLLTGTLPFRDPEIGALIWKQITEQPEPPHYRNPNVNPYLADITMKLLRKDPFERFQTAGELLGVLKDAFAGTYKLPGELARRLKETPPSVGQLFLPKFVGRAREFKILEHHLRETLKGKGEIVLIGGESGIGKSRLLDEFCRFAKFMDIEQHSGKCFEHETRPYGGIGQVFDKIAMDVKRYGFKEQSRLIPSDGLVLTELSPLFREVEFLQSLEPLADLSPEQHKFRIFGAVSAFLKKLLSLRPLLLTIDNFQWADELSIELLLHLTRNIIHADREIKDSSAMGPLMMVITYREDEIEEGSILADTLAYLRNERLCRPILLKPLTFDDVALMVQSMLGQQQIPTLFARHLDTETEGNPFFIEEMLKSLAEDGVIFWSRDQWSLNWEKLDEGPNKEISEAEIKEIMKIPEGIVDVVKRRVRKVGAEARDAVDYACVIGREFDFDLLRLATGKRENELIDVIDELLKRRVIVEAKENDTFYFYHDKIREVFLAELGDRKKRRIHSDVAEALAKKYSSNPEEHYPELAHHYYHGRNIEKSLQYLPKTGEILMSRFHNAEAALCFRRFIEIAGRLEGESFERVVPVYLDALGQLGSILSFIGRYDDAAEAFDKLRSLAEDRNDTLHLIRAVNGSGAVCLAKGKFDESRKLYQKALDLAEAHGIEAEKAASLSHLGSLAEHQGDYDQAYKNHRDALEIRRRLKDVLGIARCLGSIGEVHRYRGSYAEAQRFYRSALELSEKRGDKPGIAQNMGSIGLVHEQQGDLEKALDYNERSLKIRRELGDLRGVASNLQNIGNVYARLGQYQKALDFFLESQRIRTQLKDRFGSAGNLMNVGISYAIVGNFDQAIKYLDRSLMLGRETKDKRVIAYALIYAGEVFMFTGEYEKAMDRFTEAEALVEEMGDRYGKACILIDMAESRLKLGDKDAAVRNASMALKLAYEIGIKDIEARASLVRARIQGSVEDADHALELTNAIRSHRLLFKVYHTKGVLLRNADRVEEALDSLQKGIDIVMEIAEKIGQLRDSFLGRLDIQELFKDFLSVGGRTKSVTVPRMLDILKLVSHPPFRWLAEYSVAVHFLLRNEEKLAQSHLNNSLKLLKDTPSILQHYENSPEYREFTELVNQLTAAPAGGRLS